MPEYNNDGTHKAAAISSGGGILHSLATAANDFLVASGVGVFVKKTLAEAKTILGVDQATTSVTGVVELATDAETAAGTDTSRVTTAANLKFRHDSETENGKEQIQYPIPTSGYMLKAAADGSPATATNTDTDVASAVSLKHTQNTDTGTTATSFKINTGGSEADLQTTGLTADRDFTFPDIDTMIAGSVLTAENGFEVIAYS